MPMPFWDKSSEETEEDYIELTGTEEKSSHSKIPIHVEKLTDFMDSDRIQKKVREGTIMLINVKVLREKNVGELKRALEKIKKICDSLSGDIAGAGEDWVIVTPGSARIERAVAKE
ncbi:MAG: cell division protein SepF [Candidatus Aenigmatarchaeota archaeon]